MNLISFLQVALVKGIGDATLKKIIKFLQDKNISWESFCNENLCNDFFKGNKEMATKIQEQKERATQIAEKLHNNNIKIVFYNDNNYPQKLKYTLEDKCPAFFFYKGNINILNEKSVGFCGARRTSSKGIEIAGNCVKQLTERDICTVSGYAAGTDMIAHKTALQHSGSTIFVLAEGILCAKTKTEIKELLNEKNHLFISQFLPEQIWSAGGAMKRNKIIIGLSDAMILVESRKEGGTFAAGKEALSLRHPLFVIDFAHPKESAEANQYFIKHGGIPIRGKLNIPNIGQVLLQINNKEHAYIKNSDQLNFL